MTIETPYGTTEIYDEPVFDTGINHIKSNGFYQSCPVFKVSNDEFYKNLKLNRQRMRFGNGSPVQQYMQSTKYGKSFYITDKDKLYLKKVK